jgi:hypothetical protein
LDLKVGARKNQLASDELLESLSWPRNPAIFVVGAGQASGRLDWPPATVTGNKSSPRKALSSPGPGNLEIVRALLGREIGDVHEASSNRISRWRMPIMWRNSIVLFVFAIATLSCRGQESLPPVAQRQPVHVKIYAEPGLGPIQWPAQLEADIRRHRLASEPRRVRFVSKSPMIDRMRVNDYVFLS